LFSLVNESALLSIKKFTFGEHTRLAITLFGAKTVSNCPTIPKTDRLKALIPGINASNNLALRLEETYAELQAIRDAGGTPSGVLMSSGR